MLLEVLSAEAHRVAVMILQVNQVASAMKKVRYSQNVLLAV